MATEEERRRREEEEESEDQAAGEGSRGEMEGQGPQQDQPTDDELIAVTDAAGTGSKAEDVEGQVPEDEPTDAEILAAGDADVDGTGSKAEDVEGQDVDTYQSGGDQGAGEGSRGEMEGQDVDAEPTEPTDRPDEDLVGATPEIPEYQQPGVGENVYGDDWGYSADPLGGAQRLAIEEEGGKYDVDPTFADAAKGPEEVIVEAADPMDPARAGRAGMGVAEVDVGTGPDTATIGGPTAELQGRQADLYNMLREGAGGKGFGAQAEFERRQRASMAQAASARGIPAALVQRGLERGVAEAGREAASMGAERAERYQAALLQQTGQQEQLETQRAIKQGEMAQQAFSQSSAQEQQAFLTQAGIDAERFSQLSSQEQGVMLQNANFLQQANVMSSQQQQEANLANAGYAAEAASLAAQFQQQANMTNAEFANQVALSNQQIAAQVDVEMERLVQQALDRGMEHDVAVMNSETHRWEVQASLVHAYWKDTLQGQVALEVAKWGASSTVERMFDVDWLEMG